MFDSGSGNSLWERRTSRAGSRAYDSIAAQRRDDIVAGDGKNKTARKKKKKKWKREQKPPSSPPPGEEASRSRLRSSPRLWLPRAQPPRVHAAFQIRFIDPAESLEAETRGRPCFFLRDTNAARGGDGKAKDHYEVCTYMYSFIRMIWSDTWYARGQYCIKTDCE